MKTNQARYEHMVKALAGDVYRFAFSLCRNEPMAQDLTQETFLRAWRFFPSLRDERKAKSWLFTTARREFARQFERFEPPLDEFEPEAHGGTPGVDQEAWTVRRALLRLPIKYREVLVLQALGGYTGNEIADLLGIPRPTVNTRLFRARAHLRAALERDQPAAANAARSRS